MKYKYNSYPDHTIVLLEGLFIGGEEIDKLYLFIQEQIQNGATKIILDLEKVSYISSMMIGLLIKLNDEIIDKTGKFVLCNASKEILEVLKITGVHLVLSIFDSRQKAIEQVTVC